MALFATERSGDGTITLTPQNEADQSALMVICHGLGDTAEGFADAAEASVVAVVFAFVFVFILYHLVVVVVVVVVARQLDSMD